MSNIRFLFVDDKPNEVNDTFVPWIRARPGWHVIDVIDGTDKLIREGAIIEAIKQYRPDIVILDSWIDKNDEAGINLCREIKALPEIGSRTTVVMLTFYAHKHKHDLAKAAGARAILKKNTDQQSFLRELEAIVSSLPKTFMFIDDEPKQIEEQFVPHINAHPGWTVIDVHSPRNYDEMLKAVMQHHPDVILLDVRFPTFDGANEVGVEMCRRIKSNPQMRDITVIMFTISPHNYIHELAKKSRADGFIAKDTDAGSLISKLERIILE